MIQIVKYKCCQKIFAACTEPECYTDKDWQKSLREYATRGDTIEMIHEGSMFKFGICECNRERYDKTTQTLSIGKQDLQLKLEL